MDRVDFFYARIDLNILDHPKAFLAGVDGFGLWAWSVCYCRKHLTNGEIPFAVARAALGGSNNEALADRLVSCGLWARKDDQTIKVVNYAAKNETRAQVENKRKKAKEKKRGQRESQMSPRVSPGDIEGDRLGTDEGTTLGTPPVRPRVVPIYISISDQEGDPGEDGVDADELAAEAAIMNIEPRELEYKRAYERGIVAGKGGKYSLPINQVGFLNLLLLTHAKSEKPEKKGARLRGKDVLDWIEFYAREFAVWLAPRGEKEISIHSAFGIKGFERWLNSDVTIDTARAG